MAQSDFLIAPNQSGTSFRQDVQGMVQAAVTNSSGGTAPSPAYDCQWWVDLSTMPPTINMRNAANNGWVAIGRLVANYGLPATVSPMGAREGPGRYTQSVAGSTTATGASTALTVFRDVSVLFPVAFATAPIVIATSRNGWLGSTYGVTTTGFTYRQFDSLATTSQSVDFSYISIGT